MKVEELIKTAQENGCNAGQIALIEYIFRDYSDDLSPELKTFLEKILRTCYEDSARIIGKPAEDVALMMSNVLQKVG